MRFADTRLEAVWEKVRRGRASRREDGQLLFETDDLLGVGRLADHVKSRREGDRVYFVINRHITPTNLCVLSCSFCGFARKPGEAGAYEHTIEDMVGDGAATRRARCTSSAATTPTGRSSTTSG